MKAKQIPGSSELIQEAQRVLRVEAEALLGAVDRLDESFPLAVEILAKAQAAGGKIVLSGVGKSGNVAQKVAATLTSTGSMAVFLHPTEALHGDLGLVGKNDMLLIFSHSGSSQELLQMLPAARELCAGIVAVLGNPAGALAAHADAVIPAVISVEACPNNLAPTASSTLAMALGDALAMALQAKAGFGPDHFARFHPGGKLGKRLLARVADLMHKEGECGMLPPDAGIDDVLLALTRYPHSGVCIVEGATPSGKKKLAGVVTEGDIRRALKHKEKFFTLRARDLMSKNPSTVSAETKATEALAFMEQRERQISFLPVVDSEGGCLGVLRVHDLVLAGLS